MIGNVIHLESAKQRKLLSSVTLIIAIGVAVTNLEGLLRHRSLLDGMEAVTAALFVAGIPLLALLFGTTAGAGLRSSFTRSAEEMLPFPPIQKVFGAYLTSLIYFVSVGSLIVLASVLTGVLTESFSVFDQYNDAPTLAIFLIVVVHLHLLSFILSYWLKQPVLGGGLALVLAAIEMFLLPLGIAFQNWRSEGYYNRFLLESSALWIASAFLITLTGTVAGLAILSKNVEVEDRIGWGKGSGIVILLCSTIGLLFFWILWNVRGLERDLHPLFFLPYERNVRQQESEARGVVLETATGSTVRIEENGNRTILFQADPISAFDLSSLSQKAWNSDRFYLAGDNTLWLLTAPNPVKTPDVYEVWRAAPGKGKQRYSTFVSKDVWPSFITEKDGKVYLYGEAKSNRMAFAPLIGNEIPKWTIGGKLPNGLFLNSLDDRLSGFAQEGSLATLSDDRRELRQMLSGGEARTWNLQGEGVSSFFDKSHTVALAYSTQEGRYFALFVIRDGKARIVLCHPDGSVTQPWTESWPVNGPGKINDFRTRLIPGGGFAFLIVDDLQTKTALVLGPDGVAYPSLQMDRIWRTAQIQRDEQFIGRVDFRRLLGSRVWIVTEGHLLECDLITGKISKDLGQLVDRGRSEFFAIYNNPTPEGVYCVRDRHIYLLTWDGVHHDLGPARL